jgi:hypothetical protein
MFDPGTGFRPFGGFCEEDVEGIALVSCDVCNKEIKSYLHRWYDGRCEECNYKYKWNTLQIGSRVKIKHAEDSDVPKKISGLWVTIVDFNIRKNPQFLCPRTNMIRTLKFSNMDEVASKWVRR